MSLGNCAAISYPRKMVMIYYLKYIMSILKTGSLLLFCKGTYIPRVSDLFIGMCFSVLFPPRSLVSADFPGKFHLLFLRLGSTIPENTRIFSEIMNVYFKYSYISIFLTYCLLKQIRLAYYTIFSCFFLFC